MNSEIVPSGEAIIETDFGDLHIGLYCTEAPKTCKVFVERSLKGVYENLPIEKIIPKFLVQTSVTNYTDDAETPREVHSRLKFSQRGILGMVE